MQKEKKTAQSPSIQRFGKIPRHRKMTANFAEMNQTLQQKNVSSFITSVESAIKIIHKDCEKFKLKLEYVQFQPKKFIRSI